MITSSQRHYKIVGTIKSLTVSLVCLELLTDPVTQLLSATEVDDYTSYVQTVVKGPVKVNTDELGFLNRALTERWQPDFKLEKEKSDALLKIIQENWAD